MVLVEGVLMSTIGGCLGILFASLFLFYQSISIGNEGLILAFTPSITVVVTGICVSLSLGLLAGIYPALLVGKHSITESLRTA